MVRLICTLTLLAAVNGPILFCWIEAALSPDGRQLATLDRTGMAIMDLESRRSTVLLPPDRAGRNLTFSPDGKALYFIGAGNVLQRYTLTDGTTRKALSGLSGPFAISPDGKKIAFVADTGLMIANSDGREERKLTTFQAKNCRLWFPSIETVVLETVGVGLDQQGHNRLSTFAVATGERRELLSGGQTMRFIWPPGKAGLFELRVSGGIEYRTALGQVWRRPTVDAEWSQVTDDRLGFIDLIGVSADGSTIALKRPILSDTSFDGFFGTITSWIKTSGRMPLSPRSIQGYELVLVKIRPAP
jgi:hypothetical protein